MTQRSKKLLHCTRFTCDCGERQKERASLLTGASRADSAVAGRVDDGIGPGNSDATEEDQGNCLRGIGGR